MLSKIVKIRRRGVKTEPRATSKTMKTPTRTRVVRLRKSDPLDLVRSETDAVAPPTYIDDDARSGFWLFKMPTLSRIRDTVAIAASEYGSFERLAQTIADFPSLPRNGFMLRIMACCWGRLSWLKLVKGIGSPEGWVSPYTLETPGIARVEFSAY